MTLEECMKVHEQARLDVAAASEKLHEAQESLTEATTRWINSMYAIDRHVLCRACQARPGADCDWDGSTLLNHMVHAARQRDARTAAGVM